MSSKNPKHAVLAGLAELAKGLAHPHRLEILEQLAQGERSVEALANVPMATAMAGSLFTRQVHKIRPGNAAVPTNTSWKTAIPDSPTLTFGEDPGSAVLRCPDGNSRIRDSVGRFRFAPFGFTVAPQRTVM